MGHFIDSHSQVKKLLMIRNNCVSKASTDLISHLASSSCLFIEHVYSVFRYAKSFTKISVTHCCLRIQLEQELEDMLHKTDSEWMAIVT